MTLAGVVGSAVDSLLGATVQAGFECPACRRPTERAVHACGTACRHVRGVRWMTNDTVNLLAVSAAAGLGAAVAR